MSWILSIAGGLVGLIVLLALIGLVLPRGHVSSRRAHLARPREDVWRAIDDVERYPTWRKGVTAVARDGRAFTETSSHGKIRYEVVEAQAPGLRITRIADPKLPFGGRWIYELAEDRGGTRLTITEDGFITNPVFRTLSRTVFSTTATLERFLTDLGVHLGAPATVEPAEPSSRVGAA